MRLGADEVVLSKDAAEMEKHFHTFDFILDTVSAQHDLNVYIPLLKRDGTMTLVGAAAGAITSFLIQPDFWTPSIGGFWDWRHS
jgi:D-arabinose 1-dehydrogenase-like Zn-dependent alcohol dehydrogenase